MHKFLHFKSVAMAMILCAISFTAATTAAELGTQNSTDTAPKKKIMISGHIFSVESNGFSVTTFVKDKLKAKPITCGAIDPNKESLLFYKLDDVQAKELVKWFTSTAKATLLATPKVLVLDGEQATLRTGKDIKYIKEYKEPNDPSGDPEPIYDTIASGTQFDVTPKLQADKDGQNIILKLKFNTTKMSKMSKTLYKPGYEIELPEIETSEIQTRISVPDGQAMLVPLAGQANKMTYLLVKAVVIPVS